MGGFDDLEQVHHPHPGKPTFEFASSSAAWAMDSRRHRGCRTAGAAARAPRLAATRASRASHLTGTCSLSSFGMKSRISLAGIKYFAMSFPSIMNFRLIIPSKHF